MKLISQLGALSVIALLFTSCGQGSGSGSSGATYDNALVNSTSSVNSSTAKLASLMVDSSKVLESKRLVKNLAPAWWDTTTSMNNDVTNSGQVTPKEWMGVQLDEDAARDNGSSINVFGRIKGELGIFCTIGMVLGTDNFDDDGYPNNGTHSAKITAALSASIKTNCGLDTGGQAITVPIIVEDAGGSIYDKKLTISPPNGGTQIIFIKVTDTVIKIASSEGYTHDNDDFTAGLDYFSRTIVSIENGVLKAEYMSGTDDEGDVIGGDAVAYLHRLYYSDAANIGVVGSFIYGTGTGASDNAYILSGDPDAATPELSLTFYTDSVPLEKVCVNGNDGVISDEDNHCGGSDIANFEFPGAGTAAALRTAWGGGAGDSGEFYEGDNFINISNATALTFTDETDFNSESFSQD